MARATAEAKCANRSGDQDLLAAIKACIMKISIGLRDAPFVGTNDSMPNSMPHRVRAAISANDQREQHL
ncbi:GM14434 [Drosophila sechellia]|uniref:GM14434 n=1 Tax=Drosophila sechellia TaxID=7238 RepID=B4HXP1_DROSE|nr:GM14434 [Drosophila sechellia]